MVALNLNKEATRSCFVIALLERNVNSIMRACAGGNYVYVVTGLSNHG